MAEGRKERSRTCDEDVLEGVEREREREGRGEACFQFPPVVPSKLEPGWGGSQEWWWWKVEGNIVAGGPIGEG